MGRQRRFVGGFKMVSGTAQPADVQEIVETRLGHDKKVCQKCKVKNPQNAHACRKCGHTNFRRKASEFRGDGTSGSNI